MLCDRASHGGATNRPMSGERLGIVKLTGCRAASRPIEYLGVVLLTISWGCLSL